MYNIEAKFAKGFVKIITNTLAYFASAVLMRQKKDRLQLTGQNLGHILNARQ